MPQRPWLHYANTLRLCRERIQKSRQALETLYDKRFNRMWEYDLAVSEMSFRYAGLLVFQIQLAKAVGAVPLTTRDYQFGAERGATPFPGFRAAGPTAVTRRGGEPLLVDALCEITYIQERDGVPCYALLADDSCHLNRAPDQGAEAGQS